jgi:hypothetical protein
MAPEAREPHLGGFSRRAHASDFLFYSENVIKKEPVRFI